ncbi:uncharacterized protein LOC128665145 [Bombina bombina]|uniref:uncharacterized protein LOC128665145 n=1 Tax=Bombina bombina TaxID=8345 RepID=UPI00235A9E94|nr:uncharacterized protein LOC128665145 [Bombina bombina]
MYWDKYMLILSAITICSTDSHFLDQEWNAWKLNYDKKYITSDDEEFRRQVWEATWDKVQKHNQLADQGLKKYRLAVNHFADMTPKERESRSCFLTSGKSSTPVYDLAHNSNIPDEVDWRKTKCMTPVKNQGDFCGSCWAFATIGVIESRYCIKTDELLELSEQQLVDCDTNDNGCCGGHPVLALDYVAHFGIMKSKDYEYANKNLECSFNDKEALKLNLTKYYILPGEQNIAASVANDGPVSVGFAADEDFMFYSEGIFDGYCAPYANHAIIIVGYGTKEGEDEDDNEDYWIIKNSWGDMWGENGYAKIKRNVNMCEIGDDASTLDLI